MPSIDSTRINLAREKGIRSSIIDINKDGLPYPDSFFNLIAVIEVVEHLYNADNLFQETFRVLKPRGFMLIATPNLASWVNRLLLLFGYLPMHYEVSSKIPVEKRPFQKTFGVYGHLRLFTEKTLCTCLRHYGFIIKRVIGESFPYVKRFLLTKILDKILSCKASLASDLIILAQKPENRSG